jgi:hypothetical protein
VERPVLALSAAAVVAIIPKAEIVSGVKLLKEAGAADLRVRIRFAAVLPGNRQDRDPAVVGY